MASEWTYRGQERNRTALEMFLAPLDILPFDEKANWTYGELRARTGAPRSADRALGTMIAAHALSRDAILMINNTREFSRVAGLRLENWAE